MAACGQHIAPDRASCGSTDDGSCGGGGGGVEMHVDSFERQRKAALLGDKRGLRHDLHVNIVRWDLRRGEEWFNSLGDRDGAE